MANAGTTGERCSAPHGHPSADARAQRTDRLDRSRNPPSWVVLYGSLSRVWCGERVRGADVPFQVDGSTSQRRRRTLQQLTGLLQRIKSREEKRRRKNNCLPAGDGSDARRRSSDSCLPATREPLLPRSSSPAPACVADRTEILRPTRCGQERGTGAQRATDGAVAAGSSRAGGAGSSQPSERWK